MANADRIRRLAIQSPSPYVRSGPVVVPWQPLSRSLRRDEQRLVIAHGGMLAPAQVDRVDPDDASRDQLVFMGHDIAPGDENYGIDCALVELGAAQREAPARATAEVILPGARLRNDVLDIWVHLGPTINDQSWFGGAITSIQLKGREMLDAIASNYGWAGHDSQKRLQVDHLRLFTHSGPAEEMVALTLYDKPWRIIAAGSGPIRAFVTLASAPFHATIAGERPTWSLRRTLSIFAEDDALHEEMWLRAEDEPVASPTFAPRFFMKADFGIFPEILKHPPSVADSFVVASNVVPNHGYAFATDAHIGAVWNPPADYPDHDTEHRAFSWELGASAAVRCLHLFRTVVTANELTDDIGRRWYEHIYKPLRAGPLREG